MTHSLHRQGSVRSLERDYVVFTFEGDQDILTTQKARLRRKFPHSYAVLKGGFQKLGILRMLRIISKRKLKEEFKSPGPFVLNSKEELYSCLKRLKEANTGQSVVVSGLFDEVNNCLKELDLSPHTVQLSLGYFGKTELLPREEVLEITTMCGHHMVSTTLVERLASYISEGKITRKEAAQVMGKMCTCGIFNEARASKIIEALVK